MLIRIIAQKAASITDLTETKKLGLRRVKDSEMVIGTLSDDAKRLYLLDQQLFEEVAEIDQRLAGMQDGPEKSELREKRRPLVMQCNFIRMNLGRYVQYEVAYEYETCVMGIRQGWRIVVPRDPKKRKPAESMMIDLSNFVPPAN